MQMIVQLLDHLHADHFHKHAPSKLDLINRPRKPSGLITTNRREVFKCFNYRFHS